MMDNKSTVLMFKMPFRTTHFNKNQKVWVQLLTGAMAAQVTGKFRGSGRYVVAWVNWDRRDRNKYPVPEIKKFQVSSEFAIKHAIFQ